MMQVTAADAVQTHWINIRSTLAGCLDSFSFSLYVKTHTLKILIHELHESNIISHIEFHKDNVLFLINP